MSTDAARDLAIHIEAQADLYFFARYMFKERRGYCWMRNHHHQQICDALMRVYRGECTRLIINIPPRYSKTELAVVNFIAWSLGKAPDSEFIYTSYSARLAANYSYEARGMILHPAYGRVFPSVQLKGDSKAKDEWRTTAGGLVYAAGSGGTITGYGAGKVRDGFGGCFPVGTKVWTENGQIPIDEIVRRKLPVNVWSFDYNGNMELKPVVAWHENPPNDIVRVTFDDGEAIECTPDHRFWTENRGWVRADLLSVDDRLPRVYGGVEGADNVSVNADHIGRGLNPLAVLPSGSCRSVEDGELGLILGQDGPQVSMDASGRNDWHPSGNGFPSVTAPNLVDHADTDPVSFSKNGGRNADSIVNFKGAIVSEDGDGVNFSLTESSMPLAIVDIGRSCPISEIGQGIIQAVSVNVANVVTGWARADECQHDDSMNKHEPNFSAIRETDAGITATVEACLQNPSGQMVFLSGGADCSVFTANAPEVANGVKPFISGHRSPVLVEKVRHDDATFCLTVKDYHNFTIECGLVARNCIIIDDPHKASEATSDVMRQNVIDWFQTTLESRKNSPSTTPIILIMQRLHEEDLAGWLLAGGNGETWEHLNLPAIQPDGTALWPAKHNIETLRRMETASPYVFAGQYLQSPAPLAGGFFKPDRIEIVDALPATAKRGCRAWDFGATEGGGDPTAGGLLYDGGDDYWYIADMVHGQMGPDDVEKALVNTAKIDGVDVQIRIPQDPGQAGKSQAKSLVGKLSGYSAKAVPVTGDKSTRASPFAAQVNVGNVRMVRGEWNRPLIEEMRNFPNAKHDDRIDALADAFNHLNEGNLGLFEHLQQEAERLNARKEEQKQGNAESWLNHLAGSSPR